MSLVYPASPEGLSFKVQDNLPWIPSLDNLPLDVLRVLIGKFKPQELHALQHTNHRFRRLISSSRIQHLRINPIRHAAERGWWSLVKWLHAKLHCPLDVWICSIAAKEGNIEVLKWAVDHGCRCSSSAFGFAALRGHLEVLKWMHSNGFQWDEWTCCAAAVGGHLEVLKWACLNGCPWDESTCREASVNGHLEVLKWARDNDCPWQPSVCYAKAHRYPEVQKWILENTG